jgi:hypothetical protein
VPPPVLANADSHNSAHDCHRWGYSIGRRASSDFAALTSGIELLVSASSAPRRGSIRTARSTTDPMESLAET